jgi:hypothetical protein
MHFLQIQQIHRVCRQPRDPYRAIPIYACYPYVRVLFANSTNSTGVYIRTNTLAGSFVFTHPLELLKLTNLPSRTDLLIAKL